MKILMVCLGNICRSPLAEGILRSKVGDKHVVDSCGTIDFHEGKSPDPRSIEVAAQHGIDISHQKSRPIHPDDLKIFDRIYVMDQNNYDEVKKYASNELEDSKIQLILDKIPNSSIREVPDPYYGGKEGFQQVYELLDSATNQIVNQL